MVSLNLSWACDATHIRGMDRKMARVYMEGMLDKELAAGVGIRKG